jgi:hypothetical protein
LRSACRAFRFHPLSKLRPRGAWTREGGLRKRWPAPNLADGALCRQDLGLTLLHHVADRRTLEALVLNWYQMMAVRTRRASVIQRTSSFGGCTADDGSTSGQKGLMLRCSNWVRFVNASFLQLLIVFLLLTRYSTAKQLQAVTRTQSGSTSTTTALYLAHYLWLILLVFFFKLYGLYSWDIYPFKE